MSLSWYFIRAAASEIRAAEFGVSKEVLVAHGEECRVSGGRCRKLAPQLGETEFTVCLEA